MGLESPGRSLSLGGSGLGSLRTDNQCIGAYLKERKDVLCLQFRDSY